MIKQQLKPILDLVQTYWVKVRGVALLVALLASMLYIGWQTKKIISPPVDDLRVLERESELDSSSIRFNEETLNEVLSRSRTGPSTEPGNTGVTNPF